MPGRWTGRGWTARAVAAALLALLALPLTAAEAVAGTWGAGHYQYADGRVCRTGQTTSPLAAWTVSGGHRAYLTRAVTSNGHVDSAAPPIPAAGSSAEAFDVTPGEEFPTAEDIAAYAYLLAQGGDAATLAAAVLNQTDPAELPTCADSSAAASLVDAARLYAGPYQVSVTAAAGPARPGNPLAVSATVETTAGVPVPNARVTFAAPGARFADSPALTDAHGAAHTSMTFDSTGGDAVTVTATSSVPVGLREATVSAAATATNPTGASVPAVYPAEPTAYSGQASVTVDRTAHPAVSTLLGAQLVRTATAFQPQAQVSGLNGHAADVSFNLYGPLPLKKPATCTDIPASDWADTHISATTSVAVAGDGAAQGGDLTPAAAGCYALRTTVATTDAAPAVIRTSAPVVLTAVDTTVSTDDATPAVFAGSAATLTGTLKVTNTYGLAGRVQVRLVGPITPANGDCGADVPDWRHAARETLSASVAADGQPSTRGVDGAGTYHYRTTAPSKLGCYRVQPLLTLTDPAGESLTLGPEVARPAYVLRPTITAAVRQTWSVTPSPVQVQVTVDGLFGLAAHVRTQMYVAPAVIGGCGQAQFTQAARAGTGPETAVPGSTGPVTVDVTSGPTKKVGCYAVVPELTIDVDPQVSVAGPLGAPDARLIAGVDPNARHSVPEAPGGSGNDLTFLLTMLGVGVVLLAVAARVVLVAWRGRYWPADERWLPGDPFDLTSGGLPSGV